MLSVELPIYLAIGARRLDEVTQAVIGDLDDLVRPLHHLMFAGAGVGVAECLVQG